MAAVRQNTLDFQLSGTGKEPRGVTEGALLILLEMNEGEGTLGTEPFWGCPHISEGDTGSL